MLLVFCLSGSQGSSRRPLAPIRKHFDTTLTPPRAQSPATRGKPGKRKRLRYAHSAILCNPLQRVNYHSL
jgi:hypothetical protein